jgi:hypothetical protein
MQRIPRGQGFIEHKVKPALTAFLTRSAIPGPGQCLPAAIWKQHQILLQWINPEGFRNNEIRNHAIPSIGANDVLLTLAPKAGGMAAIRDCYAREIAKDICPGG